MKRVLVFLSGLMMLVGLTSTAGAYTITYDFELDGNGNDYTSPYVSATPPAPTVVNLQVETFDGAVPGGLTGNFAIVQGNILNHNSAPGGLSVKDQTKYLTVPNDVTSLPQTARLAFGSDYDYLGLWWGSVDSYNTISFFNNGALVESLTGSQVTAPSPANGNQIDPSTNRYVNFYGILFDEIEFKSTQYAFEADNIAVGNVVPEPGTILLLGGGLLGLGFFGRKRMVK